MFQRMIIDILMQNPIKSCHKTTSETECFMLRPSEAPRHPRMASNASNLPPRRPKDGLLAPQDGPKKLPRRPQDASKMTPDALRMVQTVPNCSKDRPDLDLGPSRPRFPTLQTSILILSWRHLGSIWEGSWVPFWTFRMPMFQQCW